jgi:hypothetical protein
MRDRAYGIMKCIAEQGKSSNQVCIFKMEEETRAEATDQRKKAGGYNQKTA